MLRLVGIIILILIIAMFAGCSAGNAGVDVTSPVDVTQGAAGGTHQLWGLWQFAADPDAATLDVVPLRDASMHLNALRFLEPPPLTYLTLESLEFNGNIVEADIGLQHPFLGLTEFTGFDVCGVLISSGSIAGFADPDIIMTGDGDTRLLNPDGFTRWWNPDEFPVNNGTMFSYIDGLLGAPDSYANFNSTINGYKYFTDGLDPDEDISTINTTNRGMFSAGQKNVRNFTIELGTAGLVFNYAVDANWMFPEGDYPYEAPDDFPPGANRPEAWRIHVTEVENTLGYADGVGSGHLSLQIDVHDWHNPDLNEVGVESLAGINQVVSGIPVSTGDGYATYELELPGSNLISDGYIDLLITVASDVTGYQNLLPGEDVSAYFLHETFVSPVVIPGDCPTQVHGEFFGKGEFLLSAMVNVAPHDAAILTSGPYAREFLLCGDGYAGCGVAAYDITDVGPSEAHGFIGLIGHGGPSSLDVSVNYENIFIVMPSDGENDEIDVYRTDGTSVQTIYSPSGGAVVCLDVTPDEELWFIELIDNIHVLHHATSVAEWSWKVVDADSQKILTDLPGLAQVFDLIYEPITERIYVYHAAMNGSITVFDASETGPPKEMTDISKTQIWAAEGPLNFISDPAYNTGADIELDLVDTDLSDCRIVIHANFTSGSTSLKKYDSDLNLLDTEALSGGPYSTFAIAVEPEENMRRLVFLPLNDFDDDYYLYDPPGDW